MARKSIRKVNLIYILKARAISLDEKFETIYIREPKKRKLCAQSGLSLSLSLSLAGLARRKQPRIFRRLSMTFRTGQYKEGQLLTLSLALFLSFDTLKNHARKSSLFSLANGKQRLTHSPGSLSFLTFSPFCAFLFSLSSSRPLDFYRRGRTGWRFHFSNSSSFFSFAA